MGFGPRSVRRLVSTDGMRSPRILAVSWGRMEVEGIGAGKDFRLYPGGGREWDWNETGTGTGDSPGIQHADLDELLAHGHDKACGAISLRRYCPDQVLGVAVQPFSCPASQPFLPAPGLPGTPFGPAPSITSQTIFTLHAAADGA